MLKKKKIKKKRVQKIVNLKLKKRARNVYLLRKEKIKKRSIIKKIYKKTGVNYRKYKNNYLYSPKVFKMLWLFIRKGFKPMIKKRKKRSLIIKKQRNIKPPYG